MSIAWITAGLALVVAGFLAWRLRALQVRIQDDKINTDDTLHELHQQLESTIFLRDSILNAVDDVLIIVDAQQKILYVNPALEILLDSNPHPVGETIIAALRQADLEVLLEDAEKLRGETVERRIEFNKRILHARAVVFQAERQQYGVLTLRDVTELQRLERARREMVSNITHELGTPITNIALLTETVLSLPIKEKHRRVYKLVKDVRREADSLTHLVQEIRDLSLIESGQMPVRLMPTDLRTAVESSVAQLRTLIESHHQTITNTILPDMLVLADDVKLQRAIKNIVHNATKFSGENGQITISATQTDDEIILAIANTGPGISADDLPRIFERFYQVDPARREGTGLGLAIVRHIALAHGGRTWAESTPGEGATFFIALVSASPASQPTRPAPAVEALPDSPDEMSSPPPDTALDPAQDQPAQDNT